MPPTSPVVGLLFGYHSNASSTSTSSFPTQKTSVTIVDAEEMEYPNTNSSSSIDDDVDESNRRIRAAIFQKIELHQKVFPQHQVVGWYRVAGGAVLWQPSRENEINDRMNVDGGGQQRQQPTEEDLIMTQMEMTRYCCNSDGGGGGGAGGAFSNSPLFVLMDASKANEDFGVIKSTTTTGGENGETTKTTTFTTALEELESGDELPLTVYETFTTAAAVADSVAGNTVVFVNAEFELETYEPERIAVERVFKTQPPSHMASSTLTTTSSSTMAAVGVGGETPSGINRKTGKKSKKDTGIHDQSRQQQLSSSISKTAFTRGPTELDTQLTSLQSSIRAMNLRVSVLLEYLQKLERREIPVEDSLLRSIDGLVRQLPLVIATLEERAANASSSALDGQSPLCELEIEYSNAMLLSYLACTAKTARAVHVFCEKFRIVCESGKSDPRRPLY